MLPGAFVHTVPTAHVSHLWAPEDRAGMCPSGHLQLLTPVFSLQSPLIPAALVCLSPLNGTFLQAGTCLRLLCVCLLSGPGSGSGDTESLIERIDAEGPACWRKHGPLVSQPHVHCSLLWDVETSEEWHLNVGGLLAPGVPLKEADLPLVERFLGFKQGGSFVGIRAIGRQGSQVAPLVKRGQRWHRLDLPCMPPSLPGGFRACFLLMGGWFGEWKSMGGVPAVAWAWWGRGMQT